MRSPISEESDSSSSRYFDSVSDMKNENETETTSRVPKKNFTLPYFQLPKPDLDEFLMEMDENLQIPEIGRSSSNVPLSEPKDSTNIVFLIGNDTLTNSNEISSLSKVPQSEPKDSTNAVFLTGNDASTNNNEISSSFKVPQSEPKDSTNIVLLIGNDTSTNNIEISSSPNFHQSEPKDSTSAVFLSGNDTPTNNNKISRNSPIKDYKSMLSSIEQLDDSKSPGIKRLVLKGYLLKKIQEKKKEEFEKSKEISKLDEEMEENNEEIILDSDSSVDEDFVEETERYSTEKIEQQSKESEVIMLSSYCGNSDNESHCSDSDNESHCSASDNESHHSDVVSEILANENGSKDYEDVEKSGGDDIFLRKKYKKPQIIDYSSEEEDIDQEETEVQETSAIERMRNDTTMEQQLSKDVKENCEEWHSKEYRDNEHKRDDIQRDLSFAEGSICSSIPSYQPGGGFRSEEDEEVSEMTQMHKSFLNSKCENISLSRNSGFRSSSELNTPILEDKFEDNSVSSACNSTPTFGLTLDDPPISESDKSEIFSSQDLNNLCSGVFKTNALQETGFGRDTSCVSQKELDVENSNKTKALPEEKVEDFFDVEAELSGDDDDGVDDDEELENDDIDNELVVVNDDELPAEEELRDEIADLHWKRMHDDDEELLQEMKEKFLDGGELNNDGNGRTRRFAWKNSDMVDYTSKENDSSSDSDASLDETWSMCKEKAKWRQKNEEEALSEELSSSRKKTFLKVNIIGKPEFAKDEENTPKHLSYKRPRGSFLHGDENSEILKKLKVAEDNCDGSRTTKHFVFRNDLSGDIAGSSKDSQCPSGSRSVFNNI